MQNKKDPASRGCQPPDEHRASHGQAFQEIANVRKTGATDETRINKKCGVREVRREGYEGRTMLRRAASASWLVVATGFQIEVDSSDVIAGVDRESPELAIQ
jgi:hypothetical protein